MSDDNNRLQQVAHGTTGMTPKLGEVMAMQVLLERAIVEAEERGEQGLADFGQDFLDRYGNVEVALADVSYFKHNYITD